MGHRWSKKLVLLSGFSFFLYGCTDHVERNRAVEESFDVIMYHVTPEGNGATVGKVYIHHADDDDPGNGVRIQPALHDLPPGEHGFHVHENPSCEPGEKDGVMVAALAAGSHHDPEHSGHHEGPDGHGHLGDLPKLLVNKYGVADTLMIVPRLSLKELKLRSLIIHAGSDNYSDNPPLGGGGARIACGIIQ
ncbi:superoxide dismutase family protein [Endozoicomonas ascidiicola]|uniref:superoxide dismutase family protein n=1 Tax=Endozoicomonas ascidiicola TaxID=1698521 RepID=UPI000AABC47E|nr:superoxide dismutase family protein [Endozoicomonas ascidiicola]